MSKYAELLALLQEDIDRIVEEKMAKRMHEVIEAMMPSLLEHVANNLKVHSSYMYSDQTLKAHQLVMQTSPGTTQTIGDSMITINQYEYEKARSDNYAAYQTLNARLQNLESKLP